MNELSSEWARWFFWLVILGTVGTAAWLIRLERRLNAKLDTSKFEEGMKELRAEGIAQRREIMSVLEKMNERGESREKYLHDFKHETAGFFNNLNLKLHLIAQKQGVNLPPLPQPPEDR